MINLTAKFIPQSITVKVSAPSLSFQTEDQIAKEYVERDPYEGDYSITPGEDAITVSTEGKRMTSDIVVEPIPKNYGRIAWNGSTLSVY